MLAALHQRLLMWWHNLGADANGSYGEVRASGNGVGAVDPFPFVDARFPPTELTVFAARARGLKAMDPSISGGTRAAPPTSPPPAAAPGHRRPPKAPPRPGASLLPLPPPPRRRNRRTTGRPPEHNLSTKRGRSSNSLKPR